MNDFEYFLKGILDNAHSQCVRCCCYIPHEKLLISGGLDSQIIVWNKASDESDSSSKSTQNNQFKVKHKFSPHRGFVLSLCKSSSNSFYSGGGDHRVFRHSISDFSMINSFIGHSGPVSSIVEKSPEELITGSWDGTARIWSLVTNQCIKVLSGHTYAVSLCVLSNNTILTGSQEKAIKFWEDYKEKHVIQNAHSDIIRKMVPINDGFLSVSNDCTIKFWLNDGTEVAQFIGHNSFIFDVMVSSYYQDHFFTASEDHSLKIWNLYSSDCLKTIRHPATIWQVLETPDGEIITCCEDGKLYFWTPYEDSSLPLSQREEFEAAIEKASESQGQNINLNNLPDIKDIGKYRGKTQGQTKMFRDNDKAIVFQWDQTSWKMIGEAISSSPSKTHYSGDNIFPEGDYDYVFDVEIEQRSGAKKLPYNNGDNMLVVAENFCARESISKDNCQQIIEFIEQNSTSKFNRSTMSQNATSPHQYDNYQSYQNTTPKSKHFPIMKYTSFTNCNTEIILEKLQISNKNYDECKPFKLNDAQIEKLKTCLSKISSKDFIRQKFNKEEIYLLFKVLGQWPMEDFLPIMDIWRAVALHPDIGSLFKGTDQGWQFISIALMSFSQSRDSPLGICSLRFLSNLFELSTMRSAMLRWQKNILDSLKAACNSTNKAVRVAFSSLLFNYSKALHEKMDVEPKFQVSDALKDMMTNETNSGSFYKCIVSIATLIYNDKALIASNKSEISKFFEMEHLKQFFDDRSIKETYDELQAYMTSQKL